MFSPPPFSENSRFVERMLRSLVQPHRAPSIVAAPIEGNTLQYLITYRGREVSAVYESKSVGLFGPQEKLSVTVRRDNKWFEVTGSRAWEILSLAQSRTGELKTYTPDNKPTWFDRGAKPLTKMIFQQIKNGQIRFCLLENANECAAYEAFVPQLGIRIRAYFTSDMWHVDRNLDIYSTNGHRGEGPLLFRLSDEREATPQNCVTYKFLSLKKLGDIIEATATGHAVAA